MTLVYLLAALAFGGVLAWLASLLRPELARWTSLLALAVSAGLLAGLAARSAPASLGPGELIEEVSLDWIPQIGARVHVAADGLSFVMIALVVFLGLVSVLVSWVEITERVGFFHLNLMLSLAGIAGVFMAFDMLLLYVFWEVMLVPMYLLIGIWGHEGKDRAALKFFLFTQGGGLLMLVAILAVYTLNGTQTGTWSFDYADFLSVDAGRTVELLLLLGFVAGFAVKLPAIGLHTWLPDAHSLAPTAGSVILAGLLLKTGAYGLIRFAVPFFPAGAQTIAPYAMAAGAVGVLYGAAMAFAQNDLKRLVAYTSVSHMGFVLLAVFAWNRYALQGAVMEMVCHGLSTGALFVVAGLLQGRLLTRDLDRMGGLWSCMPRLGGFTLLFALASLGLPGLGNFVAELLILLGAWQASVPLTCLAAAGLVAAVVYSLHVVQRVFHGPRPPSVPFVPDLNVRETAIAVTMTALLVFLGLYPAPVLSTVEPALVRLRQTAEATSTAQRSLGQAIDHPAPPLGLRRTSRPSNFDHRPPPGGAQ